MKEFMKLLFSIIVLAAILSIPYDQPMSDTAYKAVSLAILIMIAYRVR